MLDDEVSKFSNHIQSLTCPLTLQIMCFPVLASDGVLYESEALASYVKSRKSKDILSPTTREVLRLVNGKDIEKCKRYGTKNLYVKNMLDEFFNSNEQHRHLRYKPNIDIVDFLRADKTKKIRLLKERKNCFKKEIIYGLMILQIIDGTLTFMLDITMNYI